jgi:hypothetical protein
MGIWICSQGLSPPGDVRRARRAYNKGQVDHALELLYEGKSRAAPKNVRFFMQAALDLDVRALLGVLPA